MNTTFSQGNYGIDISINVHTMGEGVARQSITKLKIVDLMIMMIRSYEPFMRFDRETTKAPYFCVRDFEEKIFKYVKVFKVEEIKSFIDYMNDLKMNELIRNKHKKLAKIYELGDHVDKRFYLTVRTDSKSVTKCKWVDNIFKDIDINDEFSLVKAMTKDNTEKKISRCKELDEARKVPLPEIRLIDDSPIYDFKRKHENIDILTF